MATMGAASSAFKNNTSSQKQKMYSTSLSNAAVNSNLSISNSSTSSNTYLNGSYINSGGIYTINSDTTYWPRNGLEIFAEYIILIKTEEEIKTLLEEIRVAINTSDDLEDQKDLEFSDILVAILKKRHFSEEFLLDYLDDIASVHEPKKVIFERHKADILSKSYSTLALRLLMSEDA